MSLWVRTIWVVMVLIVPGGFLLFLGFALGRAWLRRYRVAQASGAATRSVFASLSWGEVARELRALASPPRTRQDADAT